MYIQIEESKGLARDMNSLAVVNTDKVALSRHRAQRETINNERKMVQTVLSEIGELRTQMAELRNVVNSCISRQVGNHA